MLSLHHATSSEISKLTTHQYSTSFTLGIKAFPRAIRSHIYAIYAFSRYTDEIVDTFLDLSIEERRILLHDYRNSTYRAIKNKVSPYPVLHSFQRTVNQFAIPKELIEAFFNSMEMDLENGEHSGTTYDEYIYGSAEVIGLMCLKVFVNGDQKAFESLKNSARKLGAAFQKVNFLRDMKSDFEDRGRIYFPNVLFNSFDEHSKKLIEKDIQADFEAAFEGILRLPKDVRKGVYLAYKYYYALFKKLCHVSPAAIQENRIRIPNAMKLFILLRILIAPNLKASGINGLDQA
ncbi:MAG: phytoene/squalene synthase family protein [Bacteroidetes bacterium]|nr:phytoene/squalene synthase family protein [Bacteroidota bacterium]